MTRHKNRSEKKHCSKSDDDVSNLQGLQKLPKIRADTTNDRRIDALKIIPDSGITSKNNSDEPLKFCQERQRVADKILQRCTSKNVSIQARQVPYWNQKYVYPIDGIQVEIPHRFENSSYQEEEISVHNDMQREIELDKKRQAMLETKERQLNFFRKCKKTKTEENHISNISPSKEGKSIKRHKKPLKESRDDDNFQPYEISEDPAWQRHMATSHDNAIWQRHVPVKINHTNLVPHKYSILPPIKAHQQAQNNNLAIPMNVSADGSSDSNLSDIELDIENMSGHCEVVRMDKKLQQELKLDLSFTKTPVPKNKSNAPSKQCRSKENCKLTGIRDNTSERL